MWSDLKNNHNKFYIIQAIQEKTGPQRCFLWIRYGRVGVPGVSDRKYIGNLSQAASNFFSQERKKKSKGYTEIKMSLGSSSKPIEPIVSLNKITTSYFPSKLDSNV